MQAFPRHISSCGWTLYHSLMALLACFSCSYCILLCQSLAIASCVLGDVKFSRLCIYYANFVLFSYPVTKVISATVPRGLIRSDTALVALVQCFGARSRTFVLIRNEISDQNDVKILHLPRYERVFINQEGIDQSDNVCMTCFFDLFGWRTLGLIPKWSVTQRAIEEMKVLRATLFSKLSIKRYTTRGRKLT